MIDRLQVKRSLIVKQAILQWRFNPFLEPTSTRQWG